MFLTLLDRESDKVKYRWFLCECGVEKLINKHHVKDGLIKSCGCYQRQVRIENGLKLLPKPGTVFNYLTFLGESPNTSEKKRGIFLCECGNKKSIIITKVSTGLTKSCSCSLRQKSVVTHGMCQTRAYRIWAGILQRTTNPNTQCYNNYMGRGLTVCDRWKVFENFWEDVKGIYSDDLTIERIDNDKGYDPSNVKFANKTEQNRNKRSKRSKSGCKGVRWLFGSWSVRFRHSRGEFNQHGIACKLEAVMTYHQKYLELVGREPYYQTMP